MKFILDTSGHFYSEAEADYLSQLGFTFQPCVDTYYGEFSKSDKKVDIEINTLEELMTFVGKYGRIVLGRNYIEIYDDYRE